MGQIYRNTTNPEAATGDGVAMAFRAGAEVSDMEFVQFHPTVLYLKKAPRFLLSEALRSEGAYLRNIELDRFMAKYHPLAEQAPGDVVARAIMHEMEVSRAKDPFVYLDLTHLNAARVQKRFSRIYATFMKHNIDITEDVDSGSPRRALFDRRSANRPMRARPVLLDSTPQAKRLRAASMARTDSSATPCLRAWYMERAREKPCGKNCSPRASLRARRKLRHRTGRWTRELRS